MLLMLSTARAIDMDADGYEVPEDCREVDASVNPAMAEDGVDDTDEDCDGSLTVQRLWVADFKAVSADPGFVLTNAGGPSSSPAVPDAVRFRPQGGGNDAILALSGPLHFESGKLTVAVWFSEITGAITCDVEASWSGAGFDTAALTMVGGWQRAFLDVPPGEDADVAIVCQGSSSTRARIEWMSIQNGPYEWPPVSELKVEYSGLGMPGGGVNTVVSVSQPYDEDGGIVLAGSDVGGLTWTEYPDPETVATPWYTASGRIDDWDTNPEMALGEAVALWRHDEPGGEPGHREPNEFDVFVLTNKLNDWGTGFWWSPNISAADQDWIEIDDRLSALKHQDDCTYGNLDEEDTTSNKSISSGDLLVDFPGYPRYLVVGSGGFDAAADYRGVWLWEKGTLDATPPREPAFEVFSGLPVGEDYRALPSALATGEVDGIPYILVGYRVVADDSLGPSALYVCPADFDPASPPTLPPPTCVPVEDDVDGTMALDVRDIEADPENPIPLLIGGQLMDRFFIADGGGAWDGVECVEGRDDSTVLVLTVGHDAGGWSFRVWDSDPVAAPTEPVWLETATTYYANSDDACYHNPADSWGNLLPPTPGYGLQGAAVGSITVDPLGEWIYAFYPSGNQSRRFGCVNMFRAPLPSRTEFPDDTALEWAPFQEYTDIATTTVDNSWQYTDTHAYRRRGEVYTMGSFLEDEPLPEMFGSAYVQDADFVPGYTTSLLLGSSHLWWVLQDGHSVGTEGIGWDSPVGAALDHAAFVMSFAGADSEPVFQDLSSHSIAACPDCGAHVGNVTVDALLGGGTGDWKYANLYAETEAKWQEPADRPCEFHMMISRGRDVEVWFDRDGEDAQAWAMFQPQDDEDPLGGRALFFSEYGAESAEPLGSEWCWDGVHRDIDDTTGFVQGRGYLKGNGSPQMDPWLLYCLDGNEVTPDEHGFAPCAAEESDPRTFAMGYPTALEVVGRDVALATAVPAPLIGGTTTVDDDLAGLWMVRNEPSGLLYDKIPFGEPFATTSTCSEIDFFAYTNLNTLSVHPDSGPEEGDPVRVFVSSRAACGGGVAEVTWTRGDEASAVWRQVDLSACSLEDSTTGLFNVWGTTASADGRWLFAFGGVNATDPGITSICAVDLFTWDEVAESYDPATEVFSSDTVPLHLTTLVSHPHLADTWIAGGYTTVGCPDCVRGGLVAFQRRPSWDVVSGDWVDEWEVDPIGARGLGLRMVSDIDLGPGQGERTDPISRLYLATAGGSWWEGRFEW